jgi:hypothetical protein
MGTQIQAVRVSRLYSLCIMLIVALVDTSSHDKAFRRYAAGIDRVLSIFDSGLREWADYISFLSRLLKALQNHSEGLSVVPNKFTVAKRLAQCLHPSLPSGVHQKALEVYGFIFALIGPSGLSNDLGVYLPGIAPTLTFASISVRPLFLSLVEEYILKLPIASLRPAIKALILALLPGLEEETTDDFEKTLQTLSNCWHTFSSAGLGELFWQNLFLAAITSPSRRQGIVAYLSRNLPKLGRTDPDLIEHTEHHRSLDYEASLLTTPEPGLLLRCFAAGLADDHILIQRAFLDLLVSHLPLDSFVLRRPAASEDVRLLLSAAVCVVLRRDMSLNRRLWSWFLGSGSSQNKKLDIASSLQALDQETERDLVARPESPSYFEVYVATPLIQSLDHMVMQNSQVPSDNARPFRVALSLMDRWEIGGPVINVIFLPLLRRLQSYQQSAASEEDFDEVFRSANVFFDGVESALIWSKLLDLLAPREVNTRTALDNLTFAEFILANFNLTEEDMQMHHIPLVTLAMMANLAGRWHKLGKSYLATPHDYELQSKTFTLIEMLIERIPDRALNSLDSNVSECEAIATSMGSTDTILADIESFFDRSQDDMEPAEPPLSARAMGARFLQLMSQLITNEFESAADGRDLSRQVHILSLVLEKVHRSDGLDDSALMASLALSLSDQSANPPTFFQLSSASALFLQLHARRLLDRATSFDDAKAFVPILVRNLWTFLSPRYLQHHIEIVYILEDLQILFWEDELVTSTIMSLLIQTDAVKGEHYQPNKESVEHFVLLWTHRHVEGESLHPDPDDASPSSSMQSRENQLAARAAFSSMLEEALISVIGTLRGPKSEAHAACRNWLQGLADLSRYDHRVKSNHFDPY